jgi:hypothetical protein
MDKFTLEQELDMFAHRQNRSRFQKLLDETGGGERRKQISEDALQADPEDEPDSQVPPRG